MGTLSSLNRQRHPPARSDNVDDALSKLQRALDTAWESIQPIEEDPEKKKKLQKQCVGR